jgi:hypothetical protein
VLLQGTFALVLAVTRTFQEILNSVMCVEMTFFALTVAVASSGRGLRQWRQSMVEASRVVSLEVVPGRRTKCDTAEKKKTAASV